MGTDLDHAWVEQFVLRGHPDLPVARWDAVLPDGSALGSMVRDEGSWPAGETTYTLLDANEQVLATVQPDHSTSRHRFVVSAPDVSAPDVSAPDVSAPGGRPIGTFEPSTGAFQPLGLSLRTVDDVRLRLAGPGADGVQPLTTAAGEVVGEVRPDPAAPGGAAGQGLLVRLSETLVGPARLLAVVAVCCRDLVELEERRTQGGRRFGS